MMTTGNALHACLRRFGRIDQYAEVLTISARTADTWWAYARSWLGVELGKAANVGNRLAWSPPRSSFRIGRGNPACRMHKEEAKN